MSDSEPPAKGKSHRRMPGIRAWIYVLLIVPFALIALAVVGYAELRIPLPSRQPVTIEISAGESFRNIVDQLQRRGVFASDGQAGYLRVWARVSGAARKLRAGEYQIRPGTTPLGLLALLESNDVVLHQLTLVDGWRFSQVWAAVVDDPALRHTLPPDASPSEVMAAIGHAGEPAEGMFFPDTYSFPRNESDVALLRRAYTEMARHLQSIWTGRAPDLPLADSYQLLTLASIVEKETAQPSELPRVAGVFVRRLRIGMRLQADPTVIYGLGAKFDGNLTRQELATPTPYNTYTQAGLPPTPICLPGAAALIATAHPAKGSALYFVAKGNGTHAFADTLAQQNANVRRYQLHQRN